MNISVEKATPEKLQSLGVKSWSPWSCEPTEFDWEYAETEQAYLTAGRVIVHSDQGAVEIKAGDIVVFPKGLKCRWEVLEAVRKVYRFE